MSQNGQTEVEENQAECKMSFAFPPSMAVKIRTAVKSKRNANPAFSKNDFARMVFLDYFRRHPS